MEKIRVTKVNDEILLSDNQVELHQIPVAAVMEFQLGIVLMYLGSAVS